MLVQILSVFLLLLAQVQGQVLEYHTFQPPFTEVDSAGVRSASPHWRSSGTTVVNSNFIRLTPDRQSKKGALWSRKPLGVNTVSSILKFRISGQGKTFFGDGIGMWFTQQGFHVEGPIHGFQEKFVGVGVIFDTFKNTENMASHRDVTILINDGTKTYDMMIKDVIGCNTNVRYHNERADFSVLDSSRAKIVIHDDAMEVLIDAQNSGEWSPCASIPTLNLPKDWLKSSHVGLTATTGQLADNHDILYLKSYTDPLILEKDEKEDQSKPHFDFEPNSTYDDKINKLFEVINAMIDDLHTLDHQVEHSNVATIDHIKNLLAKMEKREDKSETRIENIETLIKQQVEGSLEKRLSALELQMKSLVDRKMTNIESALDRKMGTLETKATEIASQSSSSWKLPFIILILFIGAAGVGLYLFYLKIQKMHLL